MRLYVAGKITDCPEFFENFADGVNEVRALGHIPVNPCDDITEGWFEGMHKDIPLMLSCDGVFALRNWHQSRGARIEVNLALDLGKPVIFQK